MRGQSSTEQMASGISHIIPERTDSLRRTMPLNDDPDAMTDEAYSELLAEAEANAEPCPVAVPADEVDAALGRLDNGE
jgi:hypothetical protein